MPHSHPPAAGSPACPPRGLSPCLPPCLGPVRPGLARDICRLLPQWPLGVESERVQAGLARALLSLTSRPQAARPDLARTAAALALWAWQEHPFSAFQAGLLPGAWAEAGLPGHPAVALAARLAPAFADREARDQGTALRGLLLAGEYGLAARGLMAALRQPGQAPAVLSETWNAVLALDQPDLVPALLGPEVLPGPLAPVRDRLLAEWAMVHLPPDQALARVEALDPDLWAPFSFSMKAELLLRLGREREARDLLASLWRAMPWHVNLGLKLHALERGPGPLAPDPDLARTAVLVYSWNKAEVLAATLDSLAASRTGDALVVVLDNGSTDRTPGVVAEAKARFGPERFRDVTLPVNVGAPAARNWLLSLPEVREREFAAFLDDDVLLPPDWLARLAGEALARPRVGNVGCRIRAAAPPHFLQSADYNLLPPPEATAEPVQVFDNCAGRPDLGLLTYARSAASVSGCCHLLRLDLVREVGGFDLRFTPSQFDDLDRDLRLLAAGRPAYYAGDLEVRHVQFSSLARAESPAKMGHVLGNKMKLQAKYTDKSARALFAADLELIGGEFLDLLQDLEALAGGAGKE